MCPYDQVKVAENELPELGRGRDLSKYLRLLFASSVRDV